MCLTCYISIWGVQDQCTPHGPLSWSAATAVCIHCTCIQVAAVLSGFRANHDNEHEFMHDFVETNGSSSAVIERSQLMVRADSLSLYETLLREFAAEPG